MSDERVSFTITIDVGAMVAAIKRAAEMFAAWGKHVRETLDRLMPMAAAIRDHGAQTDHGTGRWVSGICAGMLHEGCPAPELCGCSSRACGHAKPAGWRPPNPLGDLLTIRAPEFPPIPRRDFTMPYRYPVLEPRPFRFPPGTVS